ncbi:MAG: MarR family transcriptional regulator [Actinomyces sp.]|jgi:DNA-binding MarR family transcriptional regulator|nr:MarR family transcriptional regulator [Actinomyces sp.]MCI1641972.1 MarR family transcriptional regulator [Actinomyces sp.]MCI1662970.1 MarR family transcriptional regulator [Actinomyces sp.]MCI1691564.1 MarR family transcriptional regulator [Actinomyces sp.]MCI1788243.1 MarR family transcriptional regulator [Actinomyces sp.]MCI1830637.1 MarR family transcriptional regulator [Actinomyces sp.]
MNPISESGNQRSVAWRVFFEASGRLQGILETRLKRRFGLSLPDYNVLLALWEAPSHSLRMGELAERVVYSPSRLTYLVTNLSRDGWVAKVPSASDGRGFDAVLTDAGIDTVLNATELHQQTVRDYLLDDMTDADIDQIVRIFGALDRRLKLGGE